MAILLITNLGDENIVRMNKENVLVMSLRATSTEVAKEILDAWYSETVRPEEMATIDHLKDIEARHSP